MSNKPWMTPDVKGLLEAIVHDSAYDRLYILADALEEGGYAEFGPDALLALRGGPGVFVLEDADSLRLLVEGGLTLEQLISRQWLIYLAARIHDWQYDFPTDEDGNELERPEDVTWDDWYDQHRVPNEGQTLEWLLEALDSYCATGDSTCLWFDTPEFLYDEAKEMWQHYKVLTGRSPTAFDDLDDDARETRYEAPFRCAC